MEYTFITAQEINVKERTFKQLLMTVENKTIRYQVCRNGEFPQTIAVPEDAVDLYSEIKL